MCAAAVRTPDRLQLAAAVEAVAVRVGAQRQLSVCLISTLPPTGCSPDRTRRYRSGPTKTWIKVKNLQAPGVLRFEERDETG